MAQSVGALAQHNDKGVSDRSGLTEFKSTIRCLPLGPYVGRSSNKPADGRALPPDTARLPPTIMSGSRCISGIFLRSA